MKEFVSRLFLINLEKIRSNYVSNTFFTFALSSLRTTSAFLLRVDLRLSATFMRSGMAAFNVGTVRRSAWWKMILLNLFKASLLTCQSSDFS
jgi:hypothetical protein